MKLSARSFTLGAVLTLGLLPSQVTAASSASPYAPTKDPGVYPGGEQNPPNGWSSLPDIPGARIDNSTIVAGKGSATMLHYIDESYNASIIKRAVIQIHGENRDGWNQWIYSDLAAKRAATGGSFSRDEVVVMAPVFLRTNDEGAYPFDTSLDSAEANLTIPADSVNAAATNNSPEQLGSRSLGRRQRQPISLQKTSTTQIMIWKNVEWGDGSPCYEPADAANAGAFEALDAAVSFFLDKDRFPQMRKVVVAGFSLGAQLTNRYATFRSNTDQDSRVIFWISSPNSFVYLNGNRPDRIASSCATTYADYKYGLNGTLPAYVTSSGNKPTSRTLMSRYLNRTIFYLCGSKDHNAGNNDCAANAQGTNHIAKMFYFTNRYLPSLPGSTGVQGQLPSNNLLRWVEDTSHQDWKIITSDPGVETLFLKNWYANGSDAQTPPISSGVVAGNTPSLNSAPTISRNGALHLAIVGAITVCVILLF